MFQTLFSFLAPLSLSLFFYHGGAETSLESPSVFRHIAHRGGGGLKPEETLVAYENAIAHGANVLDLDIRLTRDHELILMHDETVDRTTNGHGRVSALTLNEIRNLDAGYKWSNDGGLTNPYRGIGIQIPTVSEFFSRFSKYETVIEIKDGDSLAAERLCTVLRKFGATTSTIVGSFKMEVLKYFREICPDVKTSATRSEALNFLIPQINSKTFFALHIPPKIFGIPIVTKSLIRRAQAAHILVEAWTINKESEMQRLIERGVHGIFTDYPDRLASVLKRR